MTSAFRRAAGFTLVELLVVVAIIVLLLAILLPTLRQIREVARISVCASNQHQISVGALTYASDHRGVLPPRHADPDVPQHIAGPVDSYFFYSMSSESGYSDHPGWNVGYMNLGLLYERGMVVDGHVYYCPSMEGDGLTYEDYTPWPTPGELKTRVRTSFYYNPHVDAEGTGSGPRRYGRLSQMPVDGILLMDVFYLFVQSDLTKWNAHWEQFGWNVARADGGVAFVRPPKDELLTLGEDWKIGGSQNWDAFNEALEYVR